MKKIDEIRKYAEERGYRLLSAKYQTQNSLLEFEQPDGTILKCSWKRFQEGRLEPYDTLRNPPKKIKQDLAKFNCEWVSGEYQNELSELGIVCQCSHSFTICYYSVKRQKSICQKCKFSIESKEYQQFNNTVLGKWAKEAADEGFKMIKPRSGYKGPAHKVQFIKDGQTIGLSKKQWDAGNRGEPAKRIIDLVRKKTAELGHKLISAEYSSKNQLLDFVDENGRPYQNTWKRLEKGEFEAYESLRKDQAVLKEEADRLGLTVLSDYKRAKGELKAKCKNCKTIFSTTGDSIERGFNKCPTCYPPVTIESIREKCEEWGFSCLSDEYTNNREKMKWKCHRKGHYFEKNWSNLYYHKTCSVCNISKPEFELKEILEGFGLEVLHNDRSILGGKEIDLYIPKLKLGIEYHGLYWHSEDRVGRNYHLNKLKECQELGIRLIQIFEDEWLERKDQVLNFIESKLGLNKKVYTRKCETGFVDSATARRFFNDYHIQGSVLASCYVGLFYQNELIQLMSFGKHHRQNSSDWLLSRMCTKRGLQVVGGASKLLKFGLFSIGLTSVSTFADLRYSEGEVYQALGFDKVRENKPDYSYVLGKERYSKQSLKKTAEERKLNKTEAELRREQGYLRIYDCGKIKFNYSR